MLPLIPLAVSLAPELAKWLFGSGAEKATAAVATAVQTITGTGDADAAQAVIARDPQVAAQLRVQLAQIAADAEKDARAAELATLQALVQSDTQQSDVNKLEAGTAGLFVAGWRPFVGWVCGAGLAWAFLAEPMASWVVALFAPDLQMPQIDTGLLMNLLLGMLGLGGMRTFEKLRGVGAAAPGH